MIALFVLLGFLASAEATITILYPTSNTIWYKNSTVSLNWTTTSFDSDTNFFRALLSNSDQSVLSGNNSIADSTNATADFVRILLPSLTASQGYVVNFVNTSNENQVFATSESFEIQDGVVAASTVSGTATGSSVASTTADIPNASSQKSSSNPFATTASTATSTAKSGAASLITNSNPVVVQGLAALLAVAIGMGILL